MQASDCPCVESMRHWSESSKIEAQWLANKSRVVSSSSSPVKASGSEALRWAGRWSAGVPLSRPAAGWLTSPKTATLGRAQFDQLYVTTFRLSPVLTGPQRLLLDGLLLLDCSVWAPTQMKRYRPANADRCTAGSTEAAHPPHIRLHFLGN
jgi:hypothetical protein